MTPFSTVTAPARADDTTWTTTITEDWTQGRATFGGVLSGLALRVLDDVVDGERTLRSVLVSFVGPASPGPVTVTARVLRAGRALTQAEARVSQDGRELAVVVAAYGALRQTGIAWPAAERGEVPPPESLPVFPYLPGITPVFTQHFDYRWATERYPFTGADQPAICGHLRPAEGEGPVDAAMVLALIDAWPAPVLSLAQGPAPASTVTWMVDLVGPIDPDPTRFWFFEGAATAAGEGYADIHGKLYGPEGRLVATSRQLVAEFSKAR